MAGRLIATLPAAVLLGLGSCLTAPEPPRPPSPYVQPRTVAFTGDTGYDALDTPEIDTGFERVLELVKSEQADLLVMAGDFAYEEEVDVAATYFRNVDRILGADFPVLAARGNHDDWSHYEPFLRKRFERMGLRPELISGEDYALSYAGIRWAVVGGRRKARFLTESFNVPADGAWRVCVWHENMSDMQAGGKEDGMDWASYRACQESGAIIATAHEHSYSRTRTLTALGNQAGGHGATGDPARMEVAPGSTFAFVSGLGGRPDARDYHCELHDDDTWWATVFTSNYYLRNGKQIVKSCHEGRQDDAPPLVKGYTHGVLFITFNADGDPRRAKGYFKTVDGEVIDSFTVIRPLPARTEGTVALPGSRRWLAGDHHVHSRYSVDWDDSTDPPTPILGGDARYPIPLNAEMARAHGLSWMVSTDHSGPGHSKVNRDMAYPELLTSRQSVPEVLQFYGMEFDTPGADHSTLIIPQTLDEPNVLYELEHRFSQGDAIVGDSLRDTPERMLEALSYMGTLDPAPLVFANHPARSAHDLGSYRSTTPELLRAWNDVAPSVAVGMEGAPGHQANAVHPDGSSDQTGARGGYRRYPTMGGFDQMSARLGGVWDAMLGEGRRWWITATSDLHGNWRDGGTDFWPGEYAKTYVFAEPDHTDVLDGLRNGRVFVTTGDLISELSVTVEAGGATASLGDRLQLEAGTDVRVTIRARDPSGPNHRGEHPAVSRVDLIIGEVYGPATDRSGDRNPTTRVARRFGDADWRREGEYLTMSHTIENVREDSYLRLRGTSTTELEPLPDPLGEDPWSDLWFYANPVFLETR